MAGTPEKVAVWANADVLIGNENATIPGANEDFDLTQWSYAGLLDGDGGFVLTGSRDSSDKFAWGNILVATTRKNFVQTVKFTALEKNATVYGIVHPGSSFTWTGNDFIGTRNVPDPTHKFRLALVKMSGQMEERLITAGYAQVDDLGDEEDTEDSLTMREITCKVYPTAAGVLFNESRLGANVSLVTTAIDVTPATTTLAVAATRQLVVTATYADASTEIVTAVSTYVSSNPSKATVTSNGLITAVATGSATVTATYDGMTDTCAVTVS